MIPTGEKGEVNYEIFGVIDFGDSSRDCYVFEVAIAMMVMGMARDFDPFLAASHVLAGYRSKFPLNDNELGVLKLCLAARWAQSLVMGQYTYQQDPGNLYLLSTAKSGWAILKQLWETPTEELVRQWNDVMMDYSHSL